MIFTALSSLRHNLKERVANPLIGTMIIVWLSHNWRLVFGVFNFDKTFTFQRKIDFIKQYWINNNFWGNMWYVFRWSLFILILLYVALSISRLLQTFYQRTLLPAAGLLWKGSYRTIEDYNHLLEQLSTTFENLNELKVEKSDLQVANERIESEKNTLKDNIVNLENTTIKYKVSAEDLKLNITNLTELLETKEKKINNLDFEVQYLNKSNNDIIENADLYFKFKLKNDKKYNEKFDNSIEGYGVENAMSDLDKIRDQVPLFNNYNGFDKYLFNKGYIQRALVDDNENLVYYYFTERGKYYYNTMVDVKIAQLKNMRDQTKPIEQRNHNYLNNNGNVHLK